MSYLKTVFAKLEDSFDRPDLVNGHYVNIRSLLYYLYNFHSITLIMFVLGFFSLSCIVL